MPLHKTRVGLHARNDVKFTEPDYELIRRARIETLKMMSQTDVSVYERLRRENPQLELIVRLYDDRFNSSSRPTPAEFVARMVPIINRLRLYAIKYEVHNEPNHRDGIEGWGDSDANAQNFKAWYMQVLPALKKACPWAQFGFPGLAPLHRDLPWLDICQDAIRASDWLACHCYWQNKDILSDQFGLRFKLYNERFPTTWIEITEFSNSTPPAQLSREELARQYVQYYQELNKYGYLRSASAFIASSPDPAWVPFVWMKEGGEMLPVVQAVAVMERKAVDVPVFPPPQPPPERTRLFPETGKTVRGKFLNFFDKYGLDICGYPITEQFEEFGLPSQYFQRVGLELLSSGAIRLKLVGGEAWTSRQKIAELEARIRELTQEEPVPEPSRPAIVDLVDALPKHATKTYPMRSLTDIKQIVIHHTATSADVTPQRLAEDQVNRLGRAGIIYHFVVAANGTIYQTNRLETVSDHAYTQNLASVGVCFPGNFTETIPTKAQLKAGGQLCAWLVTLLHLPTSEIVGVGEIASTQSPGKQWLTGQRWKDLLLAEVKAALDASEPDKPRISQPAIQDLVGKLPRHATKTYDTRPRSAITTLVVHHSATPPTVTPQRIAEYHVKTMDWPGIGYHFIVSADGTLYQCNALETVSYHATKANPFGVGICFLGDFTSEVPPPAQLKAGAYLVAWLMQELNIDLEHVQGHLAFTATACPGNEWLNDKKWSQMLRQETIRVQEEAAQPKPAPAS
jgi:N-acetyl-anhydromuramyl-L-alanine amidase AmpD